MAVVSSLNSLAALITMKAGLVAEECRTPEPLTSTYVGIVSRESVKISFTYIVSNGLDVWVPDL